ncbi:hypothetical protein FHS77_003070 [Paenochrobactrum gallinarii]|uniref:Uncharacterized protein n=1 Tax=Paenochrobactrum gallinarii TaxID=643673 RepID=A0A841LVV5_9HYPH|nr:hypothetical protein [Paenochrobactrum gallinarii]MBB6262495.1 hypothetical protein [Paenochrobactrum gallinarii]
MAYDKYTEREWVVSLKLIEAARNSGQAGVEARLGTIAVKAIRREDADLPPFKWFGYGVIADFIVVYSAGQRNVKSKT